MIRIGIVILLIFSLHCQAQEIDPSACRLKYNQRRGLVGFDMKIELQNKLSEQEIYNRIVRWFNDEFQVYNVVISLKDSLGGIMTDGLEGNSKSLFSAGDNAKETRYRIQGRFLEDYNFRKFGIYKSVILSGILYILIYPDQLHITITSFKLTELGFIPLEEQCLNKDGEFKRKYRKLKGVMSEKVCMLVGSLKTWIYNYDELIDDKNGWRNFDE
jgi:hypothetical protein